MSVLPVLAAQAPELATLVAVELVRASAVAFLGQGNVGLFPDPGLSVLHGISHDSW
jgi:hypothetical protein